MVHGVIPVWAGLRPVVTAASTPNVKVGLLKDGWAAKALPGPPTTGSAAEPTAAVAMSAVAPNRRFFLISGPSS